MLAGADLDFPSDADRRAAARLLGESGSPSAGAPSGGHRVHDLRTVHQTVGRWWEGAGLPEVAVTFAVGTAKDVIVDGERFTPVDVARILRALA